VHSLLATDSWLACLQCRASECSLLCMDFERLGYGRIMIGGWAATFRRTFAVPGSTA
jgi:hypothetical protein